MASNSLSHSSIQYHEFHRKFDLNPYQSFMEKHLQHYGYFSSKTEAERSFSRETESKRNEMGNVDENEDDAKSNQVQMLLKDGKQVSKLREPRNLFALMVGPNIGAKYPFDMQVIPQPIEHIHWVPEKPEPLYKFTGTEPAPMVKGVDRGGTLVYQYIATHTDYFVRSAVRGNCQLRPVNFSDSNLDNLKFESRFESANLEEALKLGPHEYELSLRYDLYTEKHTQWFYFQVSNAKPGVKYQFTIVNLMKSNSLYNSGMKPCFYSEIDAKTKKIGWRREGFDIKYFRNNTQRPDSHRPFYSLTFSFEFLNGPEDKCYFAHCYPYTYTMLQNYLQDIADHPAKSKICKQRILCKSLGGNIAYVLTITNPARGQPGQVSRSNQGSFGGKKSVVITARVHPGESNASWMMKGVLDYLLGDSPDANLLRESFIFKVIPMLNPDGVIVGNYRCSLAGRDLNRNYKSALRDAYPTIWSTRQLIKKMRDEIGVVLYVDLHGHSRKQNVFMYGCEKLSVSSQRLKSRIFPFMLSKNSPSAFSYKSSKFKVQKSKEGCGRICMWNMGISNSYTMESTFCGSTLGQKRGFHFSTKDLELLGYHLLDTLLDYSDPNPIKYAKVLSELELDLRREIMKKWEAKGIKRDISSISEKDLAQMLEAASDSEVESSTSGSDSSDDNGLPIHMMEMTQQPLKTSVKRLKTKNELNKFRHVTLTNTETKLKLNKNMSKFPDTKMTKLDEANFDSKHRIAKFNNANEQKARKDSREESASSKKSLMRYASTKRREQSLINLREVDSGPSRLAGMVDFSELYSEPQTSIADVEVFEVGGLTKKGTTRRDVSTQFTPLPQTHKHVLETSAAQQRQQDRLRDAKKKAQSMLSPFGEWNNKPGKNSMQVASSSNPVKPSGNDQTMRNLEKAYKDQSSLHWLPKQIRKNNQSNIKHMSSTATSQDRIIPATSLNPKPRTGSVPEAAQVPNNSLSYPRGAEMQQLSLTERLISKNGIGGLNSESMQLINNSEQETKSFFASHLRLNGIMSQSFETSSDMKNNACFSDSPNSFVNTKPDESTERPKPTTIFGEGSKIKNKNEGLIYLRASQERTANEEKLQKEREKFHESLNKSNENQNPQKSRSEFRFKIDNFGQKKRETEDMNNQERVESRLESELEELGIYNDSESESDNRLKSLKWKSNIRLESGRNSVDVSLKNSEVKNDIQILTPNGKKVKIGDTIISADDAGLNSDIAIAPELLEIQEQKVRLASAKSEVRHRKLRFIDEVHSGNDDNSYKDSEDRNQESALTVDSSRQKDRQVAELDNKNDKHRKTLDQADYQGLTVREFSFGRVQSQKNSDSKISEHYPRQNFSTDGNSHNSLVNISLSKYSKFEHNLKLSPRPVSDHSLMSNRNLKPPVKRYETTQKKKIDIEGFLKE